MTSKTKHRVQFTDTELKATIYGLKMELDSIHTVWMDVKDHEAEEEWKLTLEYQYELLSNVVHKLNNHLTKEEK